MTAEYARTEWDRALEALAAATLLRAHGGFDSAASRAYYAAFHAASALFALEGRTFPNTRRSRLRSTAISSRRGDGRPISGAITAFVSLCVASAIRE